MQICIDKQRQKIKTGWQADLQLLEIDLPTPIRAHNLYEQLLLYGSASIVKNVWVAGKQKVDQGVVLGADWERLKAKTRESADTLWAA